MPHAFIHLIGLSLFISISLLFCFLVKKVVNIIEMLKRGRQNETNFKFHLPSNPIPKSRHPTTTCRPSLATRKGLFRAARRRCRHINCRNRARIRRLVQEDGSGVGGVKGDVYTSFWSYSPGELWNMLKSAADFFRASDIIRIPAQPLAESTTCHPVWIEMVHQFEQWQTLLYG